MGIALIMLLTLTACGPKESAETVVKNAIESVKNMDVEAMQRYWGDNQFEDTNSEDSTSEELAVMSLIVKNLSYQVIAANEEKQTANVKVEITNLDMNSILSELIGEMMGEALGYAFLPEEQQPSEEEMNDKFIEKFTELLEQEDNSKVTKTVDIALTLVDNQWVIDTPNEDAVDAMLGGINSFSDAMNESFGEDNGGSSEMSEKDKITEIRNWVVSDIWNAGFCDLSHYYYDGKSSTGETMDPEFTMQQLDKAMEKKAEYDTYMSSLSVNYSEISELWAKVSEQIDVLYAEVKNRELKASGEELDTGLYNQYFEAFDNAYYKLP